MTAGASASSRTTPVSSLNSAFVTSSSWACTKTGAMRSACGSGNSASKSDFVFAIVTMAAP